MDKETDAGAPAWPWRATALALLAALAVPLLVVDVPPVLDYPNHLARLAYLAYGAHDPWLSRMFVTRWAIIPNLGIDVIVPPLMRLFPVHVAGRIGLGLALLLPPIGVVAYHRAVFGRRSWWPLVAAGTAYGALTLFGMESCLISVGLALLLAAAWEGPRSRGSLALAPAAGTAASAIFLCHGAGAAFLLVLLASADAADVASAIRRGALDRRALMTRALSLGIVFLGPFALYTRSTMVGVVPDGAPPGALDHLRIAGAAFMGYHPAWDAFTAAAVAGVMLACLAVGRARLAPRAFIGLPLLIAIFLRAPDASLATPLADYRAATLLTLYALATFDLSGTRRRVASLLAVAAVAVFFARAAVVEEAWRGHQRDVDMLREAIAPVQAGSKVLVATGIGPQASPGYLNRLPTARIILGRYVSDVHMGGLLTVERDAWWPNVFAFRRQQPVQVNRAFDVAAPYRTLADPHMPDWYALTEKVSLGYAVLDPFMADWQSRFEWVLILDPGGMADDPRPTAAFHGKPRAPGNFLPDFLEFVRGNDMAALYRVKHPAKAARGGPG
jgi:hypothetical protein